DRRLVVGRRRRSHEGARLDAVLTEDPVQRVLEPGLVTGEGRHPDAGVEQELHAEPERRRAPSRDLLERLKPGELLDDPLRVRRAVREWYRQRRAHDPPD